MSAKWLFTFKHFKFPLLPLLTQSAMHKEEKGEQMDFVDKIVRFLALAAGIEGRERSGGGSQERAQHRGIWLTIPTIPNTIPRAPWITLRSTIESMRDTGRLTLWPSLGIPGTQL